MIYEEVNQLYLNPACLAVRKTHQNSMPINLRKSVSLDAKNSDSLSWHIEAFLFSQRVLFYWPIFSLMLWAHGGRGPRFIEPPEPPVATPLFTSQHYQVSKSEVFDKVIPAADFWISADDIAKCNNPHISQTDEILKTTMINYTRGNVRQISLIQMCH